MDQQQRLDAMIGSIERRFALEPIALAPDVTDASAFFKYLRIRCQNWRGERIEKVSGLRFGVSLPQMDALNVIVYPKEHFDAPIFLAFVVLTKKRFICHLNLCLPFADPEYRRPWLEPLLQLRKGYGSFASDSSYPDWMQADRNEASIHGAFEGDRLDEFTRCTFAYLDSYLAGLAKAVPVDATRQQAISDFHARFKRDIRTRDRAQSMTARFIGKERARKIFYEVAT